MCEAEVERLWKEFDSIYPNFNSNGKYSIEEGERWIQTTNRYNKEVTVRIRGRGVRENEDGSFCSRFMLHMKGRNFKQTKYSDLDHIYEMINFELLLGEEDIKEPGSD